MTYQERMRLLCELEKTLRCLKLLDSFRVEDELLRYRVDLILLELRGTISDSVGAIELPPDMVPRQVASDEINYQNI